jgi:hypothetical protein
MGEWRAGRALGGRWGDYERETSPVGFWLVMTGNALAAVMGCVLSVFGLLYLLVYPGWLR